ncbi:protein unc-93 homolog A [Coturnix japonica]|uniref:Protein unc-93 homolog A n=1 Tax=Coturnix japonica TaxID=93934 RepID=A0A8C2SVM1_COTJA|nr:protein unc-93 homolog A [Coturnix japonica]XP_015713483.1 protein unc-93 homolog A [Coturnix japonica]XP_015713484.1 protein unc-93 homolog A [Coturnix japonica]XP_032299444.1 protein unc-93 homolog A [Coturnix japonica]
MERNLKNVLVISFGFLLLFTAYGGLQSLQSSLNSEEGLGVASLSVLYAALIVSSMFLPPILIKKLGCKWTIAGSMCCYIAFSLGNFYASWYTLIPTSVILGLGGAPLWSAKCTYLTIAGNSYAEKAGKIGKDIISQYFGVFFLIFQSSGIWGNLISSLILSQSSSKVEISEDDLACCGAYDCISNTANTTALAEPSKSLIYTLLGVYTASGVLAVLLIIIFLDQIKSEQAENEKEIQKTSSFWSTFLATFQHLKDKRQCLLIPLTMYSGFEQGFLAGDYTKTYVTCALGIHYVGYVMICFSAVNSLCSLLFGKISQFTGRKFLFALATVTNAACIIALLLWKPHSNQLAVFFIFPALWGLSDAIWQTQTNGLYGVLFEKHTEAAFANYRLWESCGFVIAFGYSTTLRVYIKLYILLAVLILSMVTYGVVEYLEAKRSPGTSAATEKENEGPRTQETRI